ncbi:toll/interleukin-1 receptor domain-containing protein [Flavobacterium terrisoli]|uniref:toll/interleukin-1 receptor domain-containing protein n=1 Tax=Flavobacterium terrisoli TaxID=3242195 RepID=UPI002543EAB2|nr:toll/interleukin-1 receptor domain-containing protein [Flavobacterium buctense]
MSQEIKKIFISYSWKPYTNKLKVIELAERLTNDGIHIILDDWDLKEGQDKYHFMEQMVNDETVNKVLLICNKEYAQKANEKKGGVGIESLIVSDEIYNQVEQTKFIPIVMEYENSKPCLPTFINSRIFIDLSSDEIFEENYEKLIRNIFNKPISKRPPIGKMPVHLEDESPLFLPTAHKVVQIKNSFLNGNKNSLLFIKDYLETFIQSLLLFKLDIQKDGINTNNFIEKVELSIEQMQPLKNDFIEFLNVISKYSDEDFGELFLDFFEQLLQFYEDSEVRISSSNNLQDAINDNYRFFNYDLFISFVTVLLKNERFKTLNFIYQNNFFVTKRDTAKPEVLNFTMFRQYVYTLNEFKNQSINPKRVSVVADLIKKYSTILKFEDNITSDLLNYYMSLFYPAKSSGFFRHDWFPETSCYNSWNYELFPKIISKRYFEKIKYLFDLNDVNEFKKKISELAEKEKPERGYYRIPNIKEALNFENVATLN